MKLAICNETFRDWAHDDAFRYAKQLGYDGVEIAPFTLGATALEISQSQCQELDDLATRFELEIVGLHWLLAFTRGYHVTSPDSDIRRDTADYLSRLAQVCRWLGGSVMVLGSPQQRNMAEGCSVEEANEYAIDCLTRCLPALDEHQVTLALEPLGPGEGNFLLTSRWAIELIQRVNSPRVQLHLDVKAMTSESSPIETIIRDSRDYLVHFHANDPNLRGPGMGSVRYEPIIEALKEIEYPGWISVEVFDDTLSPEVLAGESIAYLRKQLSNLTS